MKFNAVFIMMFLPVVTFAAALQDTRHLELSAEGIQTLEIRCDAGFLILIGVDGIDQIKANAEIEVSDIAENEFQKIITKQLRLSLEKRGNKAVLQAEIKKSFFREAPANINLTVEVPRSLNVSIDDGSGPVIVTSLSGGLHLNDDSGSIEISNMVGRIMVEDGSGSIDIRDIRGTVEVQDGSGSIEINLIKGDVSVIDGSGSMLIQDINGSVTVTDGSGSIAINEISQNVFINEAGSGALDIEGVKGKVTIRE
jgi:hypothetical protein